MNPGIAEEAGNTLRTFIEAVKTQPAMLVLSFANLMMVLFMYYALSKAAEFRTELIKQSFAFQRSTSEMLARCVMPDQQK